MPTFFVVGHTQTPRADGILLDDLAGASGRWDVLARCIGSGLLVSHGVRKDTEVVLWLARGPRFVRVSGATVRSLNPDERSTAALMAKALDVEPVGDHEENPLPGIHIGQGALGDVLARVAGGRPVVRLDERGREHDGPWPAEALYVLSDHRDLSSEEAETLDGAATDTYSLGPEVLQADQAIVLVHDRIRSR